MDNSISLDERLESYIECYEQEQEYNDMLKVEFNNCLNDSPLNLDPLVKSYLFSRLMQSNSLLSVYLEGIELHYNLIEEELRAF